jgi:hypothetical protein
MKVLSYGADGSYIDLEIEGAPDRAARTHALAESLRATFPAADVVTGAGAVAVFGAPLEAVRDAALRAPDHVYTAPPSVRTHIIDVVYDGPDLLDVSV